MISTVCPLEEWISLICGFFRVLNGDLITGENTFKENSTVYIDEIVGNLNDAKVPFSSTYGVRR
jgi:hypothetical protein